MTLATELTGAGFSPGQALAFNGQAATIAAAGAAQASATAINSSNVVVTGADGAKGVILPAANSCDEVVVMNNSASSLLVYPPTGAAIAVPGTGMGSANTAYTHTTYAVVTYKRFSATQWLLTKSA